MAIFGKYGNAIAPLDAMRREDMHELVHAIIELSVAPDAIAFGQRRTSAAQQHPLPEQRSDGDTRRRARQAEIKPCALHRASTLIQHHPGPRCASRREYRF